jgi:hypothetical protein
MDGVALEIHTYVWWMFYSEAPGALIEVSCDVPQSIHVKAEYAIT